jgi:hypothetical protein
MRQCRWRISVCINDGNDFQKFNAWQVTNVALFDGIIRWQGDVLIKVNRNFRGSDGSTIESLESARTDHLNPQPLFIEDTKFAELIYRILD